MQRVVLMVLMAMTVGACAQNGSRVASSPYSNGVLHSEPVFYNGKNYKMDFRYQASRRAYDVKVSGKRSEERRVGKEC